MGSKQKKKCVLLDNLKLKKTISETIWKELLLYWNYFIFCMRNPWIRDLGLFFSVGSNNLTWLFSSAVIKTSSSICTGEKRLITFPLDISWALVLCCRQSNGPEFHLISPMCNCYTWLSERSKQFFLLCCFLK